MTESLPECVLGDPSREALWACCLENPLALASPLWMSFRESLLGAFEESKDLGVRSQVRLHLSPGSYSGLPALRCIYSCLRRGSLSFPLPHTCSSQCLSHKYKWTVYHSPASVSRQLWPPEEVTDLSCCSFGVSFSWSQPPGATLLGAEGLTQPLAEEVHIRIPVLFKSLIRETSMVHATALFQPFSLRRAPIL